jgi:hypothetical protein
MRSQSFTSAFTSGSSSRSSGALNQATIRPAGA